VARAVAEVGAVLLGLPAEAPSPRGGAEDAFWELSDPRRVLTFEIKLAPEARRLVNDDVEQAEGAATATESSRGVRARGILVTPHHEIDDTALARLDRVRLMTRGSLVTQVTRLLDCLREYRHGWTEDAAARAQRRETVVSQLPPLDWLWSGAETTADWIEPEQLEQAWRGTLRAF
jgi:hypothetical protein